MTTHERVRRMFEHREADRVPITDIAWRGTVERWRREGMPAGADWVDFFGLDRMVLVFADNSPRYEERILEQTDTYRVSTTRWGVTQKEFLQADSTPEFLGFTIRDRDSWRCAKERIVPSRNRIDWAWYAAHWPRLRRAGAWIEADLYFGFDWMHSWVVGTETILVALAEDPDWCRQMFEHFLDVHLALFDMLWDAGYTFDAIRWPDDMGYKGTQFFSLDTYRAVLKPVHRRAIAWAHAKGIKAHLHSCGNILPFIPDLVEIGLDALNPLEVKAGMDPVAIKRAFGKDLVLHGGIDAALWGDLDAVEAQMRRVMPALKEGGGYLFSSDHSIPPAVSLEGYRRIVRLAKDLGAY